MCVILTSFVLPWELKTSFSVGVGQQFILVVLVIDRCGDSGESFLVIWIGVYHNQR
jgi:hypothetical protein